MTYLLRLVACLFVLLSFNAFAVDTDGDSVDNANDNCIHFSNPNQSDNDNDGIGNACDLDYNTDSASAYIAMDTNEYCAIHNDGITCWSPNSNATYDIQITSNPIQIFHIDGELCALDLDGMVRCQTPQRAGWLYENPDHKIIKIAFNNIGSGGDLAFCGITDIGEVVCVQPYGSYSNSMETNPQNFSINDNSYTKRFGPYMPNLINPFDLTLGKNSMCAVDDQGLQCWGIYLRDFFLNGPINVNEPSSLSVNHDNVLFVDNGQVICIGHCNSYNLDSMPQFSNPKSVMHTPFLDGACATDAGGVQCWGRIMFEGPTSILADYSADQTCGGWYWGCWYTETPNVINPFELQISRNHACVIGEQGLACWGQGSDDIYSSGFQHSWGLNYPTDLNFWPDSDNDGIRDSSDNCPFFPNLDQIDSDVDSLGDACDNDSDNDGIDNATDNCPANVNTNQADIDSDGFGDICDTTPNGDTDSDGIDELVDNCPSVSNADQANLDGDTFGDACDNDKDGDGVDNTLDAFPNDSTESSDSDSDNVGDNTDNCINAANFDQSDIDSDTLGDACDADMDGDGIANYTEIRFGGDEMDNTDAAVSLANVETFSETAPADSDLDGIIDSIETAAGTSNSDPSDGNQAELSALEALGINKQVPAMGGIGLLALGLSMLGLGAVRLRKK